MTFSLDILSSGFLSGIWLTMPFCFTLGILLHICRENCTARHDGHGASTKEEPSVKRLGNCSSAVGRPAEDDAIFEDNAGPVVLFYAGKSYRFDGINGGDETLPPG